MTTAEKIRVARKKAGLTQKQLGDLCGIAEPTIRKYELGKLNPKRETLEKISAPLGTFWLDLLGDSLEDRAKADKLDNDFEHAWDDWLHLNGVFFTHWGQEGKTGLLIFFLDSNESFFLTSDQATQLPQDSIKAVKNLIRTMGRKPLGLQSPLSTTDTTPPTDAPQQPPEGGE